MKSKMLIERIEKDSERFEPGVYGVERFQIVNGEIHWKQVGSSSCPPIILEAFYNDTENSITLKQADYRGRMCTADMQGVFQIIKLDNSRKISADTSVKTI